MTPPRGGGTLIPNRLAELQDASGTPLPCFALGMPPQRDADGSIVAVAGLVEEGEAKKLLLAIPSGEKEHCRGYPGWGQLSWNQRLYVARNPGDPEIKAKIAALPAGRGHFQLTPEVRKSLNNHMAQTKHPAMQMAQTKHPATQMKLENMKMLKLIIAGRPRDAQQP